MLGLIRSILYMPGNKSRMLEKAASLAVDVVVPDLEDSVPPGEKVAARRAVRAALERGIFQTTPVVVRCNAPGTEYIGADIEEVVCAGLAGLHVPKVEQPDDLRRIAEQVSRLEAARGLPAGQIQLLPGLESARALLAAYDIAVASRRTLALALGGDDFAADMGVQRTRGGEELAYARAHLAICARAADVGALDVVFADFSDAEGLEREARQARQLGYMGKFLIHPAQIAVVNQVFTPASAEIEYARRVVAAFEEGVRQGTAAVNLDGKMVDTPVVKRAQKLLALAERLGS